MGNQNREFALRSLLVVTLGELIDNGNKSMSAETFKFYAALDDLISSKFPTWEADWAAAVKAARYFAESPEGVFSGRGKLRNSRG